MNDRVAKASVEALFPYSVKWPTILKELKRYGLDYKRDLRMPGEGRDGAKGVICGLRQLDDLEKQCGPDEPKLPCPHANPGDEYPCSMCMQ